MIDIGNHAFPVPGFLNALIESGIRLFCLHIFFHGAIDGYADSCSALFKVSHLQEAVLIVGFIQSLCKLAAVYGSAELHKT